jgi:hypothetical protein
MFAAVRGSRSIRVLAEVSCDTTAKCSSMSHAPYRTMSLRLSGVGVCFVSVMAAIVILRAQITSRETQEVVVSIAHPMDARCEGQAN